MSCRGHCCVGGKLDPGKPDSRVLCRRWRLPFPNPHASVRDFRQTEVADDTWRNYLSGEPVIENRKSIIAWEKSHRKIKDDIYIPRTYQQHLKNQLYLNGVWNLSSSSEPSDIYIYLYGNPVEIRRDNHTNAKTVSDALVTYVSAINY